MSSSLAPYNVTLSDQTPTIQYSPTRDGPLSQGWNISYSGPIIPKQIDPTAAGSSSHRTTMPGARLLLNFTGTAVYLLGTAQAPGAYDVTIDSHKRAPGSDGGLLASITGLPYGDHQVGLTVVKLVEVTVQGAIVTIGLGLPGISPVQRTVNAVLMDGTIRPNPFFQYNNPPGNPWQLGPPMYIYNGMTPLVLRPEMTTAGGKRSQGSSLLFTLTQTSAFFLRGALLQGAGDDVYSVSITAVSSASSPHDSAMTARALLDPHSTWVDADEVLFWRSGLDRDATYLVEVKSEVAGANTFFGVRSVDILDAGSNGGAAGASTSSPSTPSAAATVYSTPLATLAALLTCFLVRRLLR